MIKRKLFTERKRLVVLALILGVFILVAMPDFIFASDGEFNRFHKTIMSSMSNLDSEFSVKGLDIDSEYSSMVPAIKGTYLHSIFNGGEYATHKFKNSEKKDIFYKSKYLVNSKEDQDLLFETMKDILDILIPDKTISEYQKVELIVQWLYENIEYDLTPNDFSVSPHSSFRVISHGKGYCQTYASVFQLMADLEGIDSVYVVGYGKDDLHAWNMVKIDGQWIGVDATWHKPNKPLYYTDLELFGSQREQPKNLFESLEDDLNRVKMYREFSPYID